MNNSLTLSTCWYNVKSKFTPETYKIWMSNFICNVHNFYLVIYTNTESIDLLNSILLNNTNKNIRIEIVEMNDFFCIQYDWIYNHSKNNLLNNKSEYDTDWKLNMIWNEKINFVRKTAKENYFNTKWFGWCDIGYFRGGNNMGAQEIRSWPSLCKIAKLKEEKIYYGLPGNRKNFNTLARIILNKNGENMPVVPIPANQVSVAGGFFLCHHSMLDWWWNTYYTRVSDYFNNNYLIKDDQIIIIDCIFNNINNFCLIEESNPHNDRWFVFQNFLK